jgi:plastocyanin
MYRIVSSSAAIAADAGTKLNIGGVEGTGGTIKGTVKFNGKQAPRRPIRMNADPYCDKTHNADNPAMSELYVFGTGDTLQNVFVWVSKGLEGKEIPAPSAPAVLDQQGCTYHPHVMGVVVNQPLEIINSDSTLHNVKCQPEKNAAFNEGMPVKGMKLTKKFEKPEVAVPFKCDVHAWMSSFVHVVPHPYFAVTQDDGSFEIHGLPPGKYEVSVWHEFNKFAPDKKSVEVEVKEGAAAEANFTYSPPGAK